jgi:ABC-type nitrate/sulfonate/bicarbonate transport system substrate-binding protein
MMPAPYDPTRQHSTNDLSRSDVDADKFRRDYKLSVTKALAEAEQFTQEQRQDRASMVREAEHKGRDLIHAYGDARVASWIHRSTTPDVLAAAKAADAFAKLMLLIGELARVAYE